MAFGKGKKIASKMDHEDRCCEPKASRAGFLKHISSFKTRNCMSTFTIPYSCNSVYSECCTNIGVIAKHIEVVWLSHA